MERVHNIRPLDGIKTRIRISFTGYGTGFYVLGTGLDCIYWAQVWILCTGYGTGIYVLGKGLDFMYWVRDWILCTGYGSGFYLLDTGLEITIITECSGKRLILMLKKLHQGIFSRLAGYENRREQTTVVL
jgi:hypothetical protein